MHSLDLRLALCFFAVFKGVVLDGGFKVVLSSSKRDIFFLRLGLIEEFCLDYLVGYYRVFFRSCNSDYFVSFSRLSFSTLVMRLLRVFSSGCY